MIDNRFIFNNFISPVSPGYRIKSPIRCNQELCLQCLLLLGSLGSADGDGSEVRLKEVAGVEVSVPGEGLTQSGGLASTGSCKYINRASPGKTSSLFYYPVSRSLF